MKTVVVNRKTLWLALLGVLVAAVLLLVQQGEVMIQEETVIPGVPVSAPVSEEVYPEPDEPLTEQPVAEEPTSAVLRELVTVDAPSDFYMDYRLERERTRGQRVEWLREVINNDNSSDETRQKAQNNLLSISSRMEKEMEMENLIKAKGYPDAAVLIDEWSITAVVAADNLSTEGVSGLTDLISRGTGVNTDSIVVIAKL